MALIGVDKTQIVDGIECGGVLGSQCLLFSSQCAVVHHLRIFETALIGVDKTQIVDGIERGGVLESQCLLLSSQCAAVHHLRIFETA